MSELITCRAYRDMAERGNILAVPESVAAAVRDHHRSCPSCRHWHAAFIARIDREAIAEFGEEEVTRLRERARVVALGIDDRVRAWQREHGR